MWRNWIARQTSNLKVVGSNPAMDTLWSRGVMVSTLDFESNDPGSNPGETSFGSVPERSKGRDSRSLAICFVGSNPTAINIIIYLKFTSLNGKAINPIG